MAAPGVPVKGTASAGTATSVTPSYPASVAANDIIWLLAISHQPVSIGVINTPSGFAEVAQSTYQNSTPANQGRAALFWMRAAGGETGTVSVSRTGDTGTDGCFFAQMYKQSGCATSGNPYDAVTATYGPGNATVQYGAVTVSGSERTLLAFIAQADNASTVDPPSTYTGLVTDTTATGTDAELRLCYKSNVSTDGSTTSTGGETEGWATFHVSAAPVVADTSASASSAGAATATAVGAAQTAVAANSTGAATATAVGATRTSADANSAGTSVATAVGSASIVAAAEAYSAGTSTADAVGESAASAAFNADGTATASAVSGEEVVLTSADFSSAGTSTATAEGASESQAAFSSDGSGAATAVGLATGGEAPPVVQVAGEGGGGVASLRGELLRIRDEQLRQEERDMAVIAEALREAVKTYIETTMREAA